MPEGSRGTIIRNADGTVYFLRDEVLAQCEVTEPDMAAFCNGLLDKSSNDVQGFAMAAWNYNVSSAITFQGPWAQSSFVKFDPSVSASGTVMCPGSFSGTTGFSVDPAAMYSG
jgi:hypothetical protein